MTTTKKEKPQEKTKKTIVGKAEAKPKTAKTVKAVKGTDAVKPVKKATVKAAAKTVKKVTLKPRISAKKSETTAIGTLKPAVEQVKEAHKKTVPVAVHGSEHKTAAMLKPSEVKPEVKHEVLKHHENVKPVATPIQEKPLVHKAYVAPLQSKPAHHPKPAAPVHKPTVAAAVVEPPRPVITELKELELELPIIVKDLAIKLQEKPSVLIKALMDMKIMAGLNQSIDETIVARVCEKFGYKIKKALDEEGAALISHEAEDKPEDLKPRPAMVTIMGHVDHGKTSLLDAIRKSKVVDTEHGGITQHIGAYRVVIPHGEITFLDTPGHEAFTAMRARGAKITDIVILVVAADDGIMPQTIESIDHAKAAGVSIIVAINKIDKAQAEPDRVKKQLAEHGLTAEDWGGKTITVPVSAKTGQGIDSLLEMILLEAQMLELKANPKKAAKGVVIESKISKGRGPVATLLVQNGTLHLNEHIIVGNHYGKIRAMFDHKGQAVTSAPPAFPVEVLGLAGIPAAGEQFFVIADEKQAKELAQARQEKERLKDIKDFKRVSLEDLHSQIQEGKIKELKIIIKADVQGSLEAIKQTLNKLNVSEIKLEMIHEGVGSINSSDVILAAASDALILGFNVMPDEPSKELIAKEGIDVKTYNIIYELANDIKAAIEGLLEPKLKKMFQGKVEVRKVFKLSRSGMVAGCFVIKGKVTRSSQISVVRNGASIFEGKISTLKRFKDDVREVAEGFECGITVHGFDGLQEGDTIESYDIQKIARTL